MAHRTLYLYNHIMEQGGEMTSKTETKIRWPRSIAEVKADPRVTDFSDERGNGDGVWIYLVAGYDNGDPQSHVISENTLTKALEAFRRIRKCVCADCLREMASQGGDNKSMKQKAEGDR